MFRLIVFSSILIIAIFSVQARSECDISGVWTHAAKPAKLLIDLNKSEVVVYSHDNNTKAIGLVVLKSLQQTPNSSVWDAQMYSAEEDSYVDVQITSLDCNQLTVSFNGEKVLKLVR